MGGPCGIWEAPEGPRQPRSQMWEDVAEHSGLSCLVSTSPGHSAAICQQEQGSPGGRLATWAGPWPRGPWLCDPGREDSSRQNLRRGWRTAPASSPGRQLWHRAMLRKCSELHPAQGEPQWVSAMLWFPEQGPGFVLGTPCQGQGCCSIKKESRGHKDPPPFSVLQRCWAWPRVQPNPRTQDFP